MTDLLMQVRRCAMECLSRREYASLELRYKLVRKGFEAQLVEQVLIQLQTDNLLSDERFIENYLHSRVQKGYGPLRIEQELRERGITGELLTEILDFHHPDWIIRAGQARQKRFGHQLPQEPREKAKQMRFLQYRGFTGSQIKAALSANSC